MREIVEAVPGRLDFLFCATSSCGTLRGCAEYVRARRLPVTIVHVDDRLAAGATCALILPDRGERYLDTIYDDGWVTAQFGDATQSVPIVGVGAC